MGAIKTTRSRRARLTFAVALVAIVAAAGCVFPIERTGDQIRLVDEATYTIGGREVALDFYVNDAYQCGRTGNFTFLVVEPLDDDGGQAPLWVYLHGGGVGYYDADGDYHPGDPSSNDEESFAELTGRVKNLVLRADGQVRDTTLARRIQEGYRILVPSMCDHDLHSGTGTPYPNNPNPGREDDTVNGLQANMAAVEHVAGRYSTTDVLVHGTSAGSVGAYSLAYSFAQEGIHLTGAVMDAYLIGERVQELFDSGVELPQSRDPEFDTDGVIDKIGPFVGDPNLYAERTVANGFRDVPLFDVVGSADPFCAGQLSPIPAADGENNCAWVHGLLDDAVADQPNSPHEVLVVDGVGHVVTSKTGPWLDAIDAWLAGVLAADPSPPFGGGS